MRILSYVNNFSKIDSWEFGFTQWRTCRHAMQIDQEVFLGRATILEKYKQNFNILTSFLQLKHQTFANIFPNIFANVIESRDSE